MSKLKKSLMALAVMAGTCVAPMAAFNSYAQELTNESGEVVSADATA
ncbi:MAG: hypothetical protein J6S51_03830 [Kiritimatiellae bacterium]|nr:hypothetical protein [Kiritimatiellia bacterium]